MYENKCKSPDSFSKHVYYNIPEYYVLQILSEMKAYNCLELLFTCWSSESMTVFKAKFDDNLWLTYWNELIRLYGENPTRPTRFAPIVKDLREMITQHVQNNVTLLGEFPSCSAVVINQPEYTSSSTNDNPYLKPISKTKMFLEIHLLSVRQTDCCESVVRNNLQFVSYRRIRNSCFYVV